MSYEIDSQKERTTIKIQSGNLAKDVLLEEFGKCQNGTCSCPTNEYEKLESIQISDTSNRIDLVLTPKPDKQLDMSEIENCLEFTLNKSQVK
jgi:hypothetical protein